MSLKRFAQFRQENKNESMKLKVYKGVNLKGFLSPFGRQW